ncbi:feruloyl-CoA synthase [Gilvimarinus sp. F26214L]|uniref:feruloyl-CoA synthase n=1 Tax=Gilvimarinus sp. DZF01 TaxID=3461371 RepID=UPI0040453B60
MTKVRAVQLGNLESALQRRSDGSLLLQCQSPLSSYPRTLLDRLAHWATATPDALFLAQRDPANRDRWEKLSYGEAWEKLRRLASALVDMPLSAERPIAILSGNDLQHALLGLAAMYVGIPYAPVSVQYSLVSTDHAKLKYVLDLISPGLVFVADGQRYGKAVDNAVPPDAHVLVGGNPRPDRESLLYSDFEGTPLNPRVDERHRELDPEGVAKFLFSSGSTGMPKAVINTHRMLAANQQMIRQALPFLGSTPPVLVDWLPWNHTFGGNHNFGIALYNGGSLYIDDGKPTPDGFLESVRNLRDVAPTAYYNVPKGFEELVKHLRSDPELRERFFSRVSMLFYAGAGLSQPVWDALEELALQTCGERIMMVTGLGCTETSPSALFTTGDGGFAGWLGLPIPGVDAKLVPSGGKLEIRFRGDNVTPGYWRNPELTGKAFDEEGYFCTGDAVKFVDDNDVSRGLRFDGRISEDFKLDTGTWVSAGPLRARFLDHFGTLVRDVVIVGCDRSSVGALVFPDLEVCRRLGDLSPGTADAEVLREETVREAFAQKLREFAAQATGSAARVERLMLQEEAPSLDRHEITDKGSLNARAIQDNRAELIDRLYQARTSDDLSILLQAVQATA